MDAVPIFSHRHKIKTKSNDSIFFIKDILMVFSSDFLLVKLMVVRVFKTSINRSFNADKDSCLASQQVGQTFFKTFVRILFA